MLFEKKVLIQSGKSVILSGPSTENYRGGRNV